MAQILEHPARPALNILLIEDNEGDAFLIQEMLEKTSSRDYSVLHVPTLENAEPEYRNRPFNVLLLDLNLPGTTGMEAVEKVRHDLPTTPLIVMTGMDDDQKAIGALARGAQDYIVKGQYANNILPRSIRYAIERKQFENKVIELVHFDRTTGLISRDLFMNRLEEAIAGAGQSGMDLAVMLLSLRRFKEVTATLGHDVGQKLLKTVAVRLKECFMQKDRIARLEGDEFAMLLTGDLASPESLAAFSGQALRAIERPFDIDGHSLRIGGSIGIATYPACGTDKSELITHADTALHHARQNSAGSFHFYTRKLNEELNARIMLERELRNAVRQRQLLNYYQPIVDLKTGRPCGVETLVRWQHPEKGIIQPGAFIPLAEKSDLILEISDFTMHQSCADLMEWQGLVKGPFYMSLNCTARDFQQLDFYERLCAAIVGTNVNSCQVALEITESALMEDPKQAVQTLAECRNSGASIFVDDFGTGYSSLSYLSRLPLDVLKIDRSFITDIMTNGHNLVIATATINLAHALSLKVVAEGIESKEQADLLKTLGCDAGQGYFFAKPMPKEELVPWMQRCGT